MKIPFQIIENFFNGTITTREKEELMKWRLASSENEDIFRILVNERQYTKMENAELVIPDKEKVWKLITQKITFKKTPKTISIKTFIGVAAIIAIIFMGFGYGISFVSSVFHKGILASTTISAPLGQKSKAILPDGTEVWINSGSAITYTERFASENREISMTGEAYFKVAHDKKMPFLLSIENDVLLTVLGTTFNVKSNNDLIEVALNDGSVQLTNKVTEKLLTYLKPMEKATIERINGTLQCKVDMLSEFNDNLWSLQELKFENVTFNDIILKLEKRYGLDIEFNDINLDKRYWMSIQNETIEETLNVLGKLVPLTYTIKEDKVIIQGK
ncbi:FecR family protein [Petrimonas sp.]|uniref:FecR family protein n=1 Tax=Petrimonas sp. TaxID=2023866 RepID=UPI003F510482